MQKVCGPIHKLCHSCQLTTQADCGMASQLSSHTLCLASDQSEPAISHQKVRAYGWFAVIHSAEMQTILSGHMDHVDTRIKSGSWQDAFCRWVATAMAARREPHWWEDTDGPGEHHSTQPQQSRGPTPGQQMPWLADQLRSA